MNTIINKIITIVFLLCLTSPFSAYSEQAYLTDSEEKGILIEINNMCWIHGVKEVISLIFTLLNVLLIMGNVFLPLTI